MPEWSTSAELPDPTRPSHQRRLERRRQWGRRRANTHLQAQMAQAYCPWHSSKAAAASPASAITSGRCLHSGQFLQGGVFLRHWQRRRCRRLPEVSTRLDSPSRTAGKVQGSEGEGRQGNNVARCQAMPNSRRATAGRMGSSACAASAATTQPHTCVAVAAEGAGLVGRPPLALGALRRRRHQKLLLHQRCRSASLCRCCYRCRRVAAAASSAASPLQLPGLELCQGLQRVKCLPGLPQHLM